MMALLRLAIMASHPFYRVLLPNFSGPRGLGTLLAPPVMDSLSGLLAASLTHHLHQLLLLPRWVGKRLDY